MTGAGDTGEREPAWRPGGCHCGAVRFEARLPAVIEAQSCTCSICTMTGFIHIAVSQDRFRLLSDRQALSTYTFNTGVAQHLFCRVCGIKSFYRPRSDPHGWSVDARCLDDRDALDIRLVEPFDGRFWEAHMAAVCAQASTSA